MEKGDVYHPAHYNADNRKECWDEMIDIFGEENVAIFDCINAYKYFYRAGLKEGNSLEQDIEKMKNYINHAYELLNIDMANAFVAYFKIKKIVKGE